MKKWLKARTREKSTWLGISLVIGAVLANRFGYQYADLKDALLVLAASGGILAGASTQE